MVSWGGVSIDGESTSDSGRGTEILERETKPNLDGGEKISVKVPAGIKGKNSKSRDPPNEWRHSKVLFIYLDDSARYEVHKRTGPCFTDTLFTLRHMKKRTPP